MNDPQSGFIDSTSQSGEAADALRLYREVRDLPDGQRLVIEHANGERSYLLCSEPDDDDRPPTSPIKGLMVAAALSAICYLIAILATTGV